MAILRPYKVNSYRRICDVCGRPRQIEDIRFADNVAICVLHPQYRTAQQLNRINSRIRPPRVLPVPQPKPLAPVDTYTAEESQIFSFVCRVSPFEIENVTVNNGTITGAKTLPALTWALVYLTGVLQENKRPAAWLALARSRAIALASTLISTQITTAASAFFGAFNPAGLSPGALPVYSAADAGLGLIALTRLYQITGDETYLYAAKFAAGFIVTLQASDLLLADPNPAHGPVMTAWDDQNAQYQAQYYPGDLVCYWGLSVLKAETGDITIGPRPSALASFTSDPSRLISVSKARMRAFWAVGYGGVNGFSAATPFASFDNTGTQAWSGATVTTSNWAAGLCALGEVEGATSQVSDLWTFLRSLTNTAGMDATLAPPTQFHGSAATTSVYDWASTGMLAPITTINDRAKVKTIKDTLAVPQPRYNEATPRSGDYLYLGPLGLSGAHLQPVTSGVATRERSVVRASQVGQLYRVQPQGFTGRGH